MSNQHFVPEITLIKKVTYQLVVVSNFEDESCRFINDGHDEIAPIPDSNGEFQLNVKVKLGDQDLDPSPVTHVIELGEYPFEESHTIKVSVMEMESEEIKGNGEVAVADAQEEPRPH